MDRTMRRIKRMMFNDAMKFASLAIERRNFREAKEEFLLAMDYAVSEKDRNLAKNGLKRVARLKMYHG